MKILAGWLKKRAEKKYKVIVEIAYIGDTQKIYDALYNIDTVSDVEFIAKEEFDAEEESEKTREWEERWHRQ